MDSRSFLLSESILSRSLLSSNLRRTPSQMQAPRLQTRRPMALPDVLVLLADLVADLEAHGRSLEQLKCELTRAPIPDAALAALGSRERALESDYQRLRQRLFALKETMRGGA